jgi:hypothetical protein
MNQKEEKAKLARRDFLKVATVGAVVGSVAIASKDASAADITLKDHDQGGYSETSHVAKYYELARI